MMLKKLIFLLAILLASSQVVAGEAKPLQDNSAIEVQVQRLASELRCLVCQNQTLADSHAALAQDLVQEIREMVAKGMSDKQITDYLVERYGDFVRYRPPLKASTVLLWLGPFALLVLGGVGLWLQLRKRQSMVADAPLTDAQMQEVRKLLDQ